MKIILFLHLEPPNLYVLAKFGHIFGLYNWEIIVSYILSPTHELFMLKFALSLNNHESINPIMANLLFSLSRVYMRLFVFQGVRMVSSDILYGVNFYLIYACTLLKLSCCVGLFYSILEV